MLSLITESYLRYVEPSVLKWNSFGEQKDPFGFHLNLYHTDIQFLFDYYGGQVGPL